MVSDLSRLREGEVARLAEREWREVAVSSVVSEAFGGRGGRGETFGILF